MRHLLLPLILVSSFVLTSCMGQKEEAMVPTPERPAYVTKLDNASSKIKDTKEFGACMEPSVNMCMNQVANDLARKAKSTAFCDELADVANRDACKYGVIITDATEKKDPKLCESLSDPYKKECTLTLVRMEAIDSGDIKKCDALAATGSGANPTDASRVDQCRLDTIMRGTSLDSSLCDTITDNGIQNMCVSFMKARKNEKNN